MFDWLLGLLGMRPTDERRKFFGMIDSLNAESHGGKPIITQKVLGRLRVPSGTVVLCDPQYVTLDLVGVSNVPLPEIEISARLWVYPNGSETVAAICLKLSEGSSARDRRTIGRVAIDSARIVVADKDELARHWADVGMDRFGIISTAHDDDSLLQLLSRRFNLKTRRAPRWKAHVVGPVSVELEKAILDLLATIPKYATHPFMHFRVETNGSFDRVNEMNQPWGFL